MLFIQIKVKYLYNNILCSILKDQKAKDLLKEVITFLEIGDGSIK